MLRGEDDYKREIAEKGHLVADKLTLQITWTKLMNDESQPPWVRMKAMEFLAKSQGVFINKIEHSGQMTLEQLVAGSFDEVDDDEGYED